MKAVSPKSEETAFVGEGRVKNDPENIDGTIKISGKNSGITGDILPSLLPPLPSLLFLLFPKLDRI